MDDLDKQSAEAEATTESGPTLLLMVALVMGLDFYLLAFVVPKFDAMFAALGGELPAITQVVLSLSKFVTGWLLVLVGLAAIAMVFGYRYSTRIPLAVYVVTLVLLALVIVILPVAIFYPILQLQSAVRGS